MRKCTTTRVLVLAVLGALALPALAENCGPEQYFAPHDINKTDPLRAPHPDFRKMSALARQGNAESERSLGSMYEAGYLVSECREKAAYWYGRAAKGGDAIAKAWTETNSRMERLRGGGECFGNACLTPGADGLQSAMVRADPGGTYAASVTINGKSVRGLIDTGATFVAMSAKTANELGISYSTGRQVQMTTANGTKVGHVVTLSSISVENITLDQVQAVVSAGDHPLLIGMSFLSRVTMNAGSGGMSLVKR